MGAVDYWCNIFTEEGIRQTFEEPKEVADVVKWWGLKFEGKTTQQFIEYMDAADVDIVLVPSAKMGSYETGQLIWNVSEEQVTALCDDAPGRIYGLFGIDPREGMSGVRRWEESVRNGPFVGAHLHPYGFNLPVNHRKFYPFYAKCAELGVPVVMQVGHSAERMPSAMDVSSSGSTRTATSPPTSSVAVPRDVRTGAPCAIASSTGRPKPSRRLG